MVSTLSPPSVLLGAQRPRVHSGPRFSTSAGAEAVELAAELGLFLDPWQAFVLEQSLGEKPDGRWAAFQVCLLCPRQNGKGSILEARELAGLFLFGEKKITHSAHEAKTAKDHFERMESLLRNAGYGDDKVVFRRSTTEVSILVKSTGCKLHFYTRTTHGGRGLGGDVVVLDEAYALTRDQMAALMPTMSARSLRGNPQMWFTSSAGFAGSDVLSEKKRQGEEGGSSLAYFDWSADPDADLSDRAAWAQANPGLGMRISEEFIAAELPDLGPERFGRERLGLWDQSDAGGVFGLGRWEACTSISEQPPLSGLALAVSLDSSKSAIVGAGVAGPRIEVKPLQYGPGTDWVADRAVQVQSMHRVPLIVDSRGPAAHLIPALEAAGVDVRPASTSEVLDGCAGFFELVTSGRLSHADYPDLTSAVKGAKTRMVGDRWAWGRRTSRDDVSPLEAATLAAWWADLPAWAPPPPPPPKVLASSTALHPMRTQGF